MDTQLSATAPTIKCPCGYKRNKDGTCNHALPGKVRLTWAPGSAPPPRTVKEIRREIKAVFAREPRPFIPRPRGTTLVKAKMPNPAFETDLFADAEITVFVPMKDQPKGMAYLTFVTGLGARNLARRAA